MAPTGSVKHKWVERVTEQQDNGACYSRCLLLQLHPNCGGAPAKPRSGESPWLPSSGALYCATREELSEAGVRLVAAVGDDQVDHEVQDVADSGRPRAASAHPVVKSRPTTVMLKNVPAGYSRTGLCEQLAEHGFGYAIDFLYLPIDAVTGRNEGVAFINLRTKESSRDFFKTFQGVATSACLPRFPASSVGTTCSVVRHEVQGREANMQKLCTTSNLRKWAIHEDWQPLFLDDYGIRMPLPARPLDEVKDGREVDNFSGRPRLQKSSSARNSPHLAPQAAPMDVIKLPVGESKMKASSPEFVPGSSAAAYALPQPSAQLRADAEEFVPLGSPFLPALVLAD